jgi:hypothetical protein
MARVLPPPPGSTKQAADAQNDIAERVGGLLMQVDITDA